MQKPSKKIVESAARLAAFAVSCHEELVGSGDHIDQLPPQIVEMAIALGMEPSTFLALGYELARVRK